MTAADSASGPSCQVTVARAFGAAADGLTCGTLTPPPGRPPVLAQAFLSKGELEALAGRMLQAGAEVIAPAVAGACVSAAAVASAACLHPGHAPQFIEYMAIDDPALLALGEGMPSLSLKGFFLPKNEALFRWRQKGDRVEVIPAPRETRERIVLGAKPCDAAALEIMDYVMCWDCIDELWQGRRDHTAIFTLACPVEDKSCFCTAVGAEPDGVRGADGILTPVDGGYLVEVVTERGRDVLTRHGVALSGPDEAVGGEDASEQALAFREQARARVAGNLEIDAESVRDWISTHLDDPLLVALGVRCNGCGACASVCPTCHCFDIVDEPEGVGAGTRRRCWDTCQTGKFTAHASGHNPREDQNVRYRQRINHKFSIYPLRFGEVLCTGCGRCTRTCHAGQDIVEILAAIDVAARHGSEGGAS